MAAMVSRLQCIKGASSDIHLEVDCFTPNTVMDSYFQTTGPRLNIKTVLSTYGDFHVKDKTAVRTSYL